MEAVAASPDNATSWDRVLDQVLDGVPAAAGRRALTYVCHWLAPGLAPPAVETAGAALPTLWCGDSHDKQDAVFRCSGAGSGGFDDNVNATTTVVTEVLNCLMVAAAAVTCPTATATTSTAAATTGQAVTIAKGLASAAVRMTLLLQDGLGSPRGAAYDGVQARLPADVLSTPTVCDNKDPVVELTLRCTEALATALATALNDTSLYSTATSVGVPEDTLWCALNLSSAPQGPRVLQTFRYDWSFLFVLAFILAGGVGNILVCLAVILDRRLQNVTNYFLLSLAIADLLVSLFVMPLGAIPGFLDINENP
ncbi:hypothetical protein ONE63_006720 [Megalurothrips usitatus]|uniref:G-protein coupled receptors family 1 profile domain-containing protein n=1 Tax=Megalurothrips usitatus TaxID=439358 RepID=A0AAV7XU07_9NEOP|nr:hypothetical protein ONE63_006720 [Megalurothrips usitatus]